MSPWKRLEHLRELLCVRIHESHSIGHSCVSELLPQQPSFKGISFSKFTTQEVQINFAQPTKMPLSSPSTEHRGVVRIQVGGDCGLERLYFLMSLHKDARMSGEQRRALKCYTEKLVKIP